MSANARGPAASLNARAHHQYARHRPASGARRASPALLVKKPPARAVSRTEKACAEMLSPRWPNARAAALDMLHLSSYQASRASASHRIRDVHRDRRRRHCENLHRRRAYQTVIVRARRQPISRRRRCIMPKSGADSIGAAIISRTDHWAKR